MSKPFKIVVGIDFSEPSENALGVARDMALSMPNAELHVVHVVPPPLGSVGIGGVAPNLANEFTEALSRAKNELQTLAATVSEKLGSRLAGHVRTGSAAREIPELAREMEADLIVIGTHGRVGLERVLLGSVAETVLRHAPCSVLVTRVKRPSAEERIEPPCPDCAKAGARCELHRRAHPVPHTYHEDSSTLGRESFRFD